MSDRHSENTVVTREVEIRNSLGIHARPAALFVQTANRFDADIIVEKDGNQVSGKSIMGLITLEASCGSRLRITAQGPDAHEALAEIQTLIENKFHEE